MKADLFQQIIWTECHNNYDCKTLRKFYIGNYYWYKYNYSAFEIMLDYRPASTWKLDSTRKFVYCKTAVHVSTINLTRKPASVPGFKRLLIFFVFCVVFLFCLSPFCVLCPLFKFNSIQFFINQCHTTYRYTYIQYLQLYWS